MNQNIKKDIKLLTTIVVTLLLMFTTSLLLDWQLVQEWVIRQIIIYIAIALQFLIGVVVVKYQLKPSE